MEIHYHDMLRIKSCGCEEAEAKMSPHPGEVKQVTMSSSAHTQALAWQYLALCALHVSNILKQEHKLPLKLAQFPIH